MGHSQGTITTANALSLHPALPEGSIVKYYAPAISSLRARLAAKSAGIGRNSVKYHVNGLDPINIVQPNPNPLLMVGGALGLVRDVATGFRYSDHALERHLQN